MPIPSVLRAFLFMLALVVTGACTPEPSGLTDTGEPEDTGPVKDKDVLHLVLVPEPNMPSLYRHLGTQADADRARAYGLAGSLYAPRVHTMPHLD